MLNNSFVLNAPTRIWHTEKPLRLRRTGLCATVGHWSLVMDSPPIDHVTCGQDARGGNRPEGFSLLEMMLVVTLILIVVSIATPVYKTCEVRTREAVLRDHLYNLRFLIDEFTRDYGRAPLRLRELVEKGYLGRLSRE